MGEQEPLEMLNKFVKTALPKVENERFYYSRPEKVTDSYEARRYLAPAKRNSQGKAIYGQTEFFEYHWSYKMQGNKLGDIVPTLRRILLRGPSTVPYGLKRLWWIVWLLIALLAAGAVAAVIAGVVVEAFTLGGVIVVLVGQGILASALLWGLKRAGNVVTKSFVDVARYLDKSPRSYEVRRSIRKGMVDLLQSLHDKGRYSRIVVVAHSLGAYIAYDGISYLWPQMSKLHMGPIDDTTNDPPPLAGLEQLQDAAADVQNHPIEGLTPDQQADLDNFRTKQFALWKGLRHQGNPWLITDFISVGTPMYFADILFTKNRAGFDQLLKTGELPLCPPRPIGQSVEGPTPAGTKYWWSNRGRKVIFHGAPFAVVRWTNLFFRAENSWNGDWFGDALRPLFGKGIVDHQIEGNLPGRKAPGVAHGRYFSYPDAAGPEDIATLLQEYIQLNIDNDLEDLLDAPGYLEESRVTR